MSKHFNGAPSDEGYPNEYSLDDLWSVSDWKIWRVAVEQHMLNLRERVKTLELQENVSYPKKQSIPPNILSLTTAEDDGFCGLRTCAHLVRSRRAALYQCIWLILFVVALVVLGRTELMKANGNIEAEFKPERKTQTIDYYQTNDPYEMPYIYFYFYIVNENELDVNYLYGETVNDTLEEILKSQNYFQNHAYIEYRSEQWEYEDPLPLGIEEASAFYVKESVHENTFYGYFRLKLMNPEISGTYFEFSVSIDMWNLTTNLEVGVHGLWVAVNRDIKTIRLEDMVEVLTLNPLDFEFITATIDYDEKVTRTMSNKYNHLFSTSLDVVEKFEAVDGLEACQIEIKFRSCMMIEHWEEYVHFDYFDWCSWMGGIISISSILFFWGAYYLAIYFGDNNTMGILPIMSTVFYNFEAVHLLRQRAGRTY